MMIIVIYGDQYNHFCFDEDHTDIYIEMIMIIIMIKADNEYEKDEQSLRGRPRMRPGVFSISHSRGNAPQRL